MNESQSALNKGVTAHMGPAACVELGFRSVRVLTILSERANLNLPFDIRLFIEPANL